MARDESDCGIKALGLPLVQAATGTLGTGGLRRETQGKAAWHCTSSKRPGTIEGGNSDGGAGEDRLGKDLAASVNVALAVLRQVNDKAGHLQDVFKAGACGFQNGRYVPVSRCGLLLDVAPTTWPCSSSADMPDRNSTSPLRTQLVKPYCSYCRTPKRRLLRSLPLSLLHKAILRTAISGRRNPRRSGLVAFFCNADGPELIDPDKDNQQNDRNVQRAQLPLLLQQRADRGSHNVAAPGRR